MPAKLTNAYARHLGLVKTRKAKGPRMALMSSVRPVVI